MDTKYITTESPDPVTGKSLSIGGLLIEATPVKNRGVGFGLRDHRTGRLNAILLSTANSSSSSNEQHAILRYFNTNFFVYPVYKGNLLFIWNAEIFAVMFVTESSGVYNVNKRCSMEFDGVIHECASNGWIPQKFVGLAEEI